jgi:hypothetical protein
MSISAHLARLRAVVGHDLLLLPSVSVLPVDQAGRLLLSYPNGDRTAYVTAVYEAAITDGSPAVADDELTDIAWFTREQLPRLELSRFSRALLSATGYL